MLYTATTFKLVFDYQPSDVYWCTADIGWITGHSYITYGPLANGATSVLVREHCLNIHSKLSLLSLTVNSQRICHFHTYCFMYGQRSVWF